jgi:hypothetical protein
VGSSSLSRLLVMCQTVKSSSWAMFFKTSTMQW